jgi:hypothetical protein
MIDPIILQTEYHLRDQETLFLNIREASYLLNLEFLGANSLITLLHRP